MHLALVSPLPPQASPAADWVARILPWLREDAGVTLLPGSPEQVDEGAFPDDEIRPCADLPFLLATAGIDAPVYVFADLDEHAHQVRFIREHPGVLVLLSGNIHRTLAHLTEASGSVEEYRDLLVEEHGESARGWPERFLWSPDRERVRARLPLTGVVCRRSQVVLAPPTIAARLRRRHPDVPIVDLPEDPEAAAAAIASAARSRRDVAPLPQPVWPAVEVVTVAYNSRGIIEPGLESILSQDYPNLTCTVVDNASADGTAEFVRERFPAVNLIASDQNLGFAGGNNLAFSRSRAKYVVLFNQDAIARRDFVRELVRVAERDEKVAAVGAKMLMLRCPTVFNSTGIVMNEAGFAVDRSIGQKDLDPSPVPIRVFGACGGAKLIRTAVLRELGGFDESFFMYFEDVDLCWRMRLAGYEILHAPLAVVLHDWFGDLDEKPELSPDEIDAKTHRRRFLCERNRIQCLVKNYGFRNLLRVLRELRAYDKVRLGWVRDAIRGGRDVSYFRVVGKAIRGAWTWNLLRIPSLWLRRRQTQKLRRITDLELSEFIESGVDEPSHVGDLEVIQDRHSARAPARLRMGATDDLALGTGWYGVEPVPDQEWDLRWSKGDAFFYLRVEQPARRLSLRLSRGAIETDVRVFVGPFDLGAAPVGSHEIHLMEFELPEALPARDLVEVRLQCRTFRPSELGDSADRRELGLRIAEAWLA